MNGKLIKEKREAAKLTQSELAAAIGTTKQNVYKYEQGIITNVPMDKVEAMARALETTPAYLMGWEDSRGYVDVTLMALDIQKRRNVSYNEAEKIAHTLLEVGWNSDFAVLPEMKSVPLVGEIACGAPMEAISNADEYVAMPKSVKADFALRCKGDSMDPVLHDGDLVYIRIQQDVNDGKIAAVMVDGDATLKRVYHLPNRGGVQLVSENRNYLPMFYDENNSDELRVIGLAVAIHRTLR